MSRPQPGRRDDYSAFTTITTRWFDNDIYGHMNNAMHYQLFDTAVNGMLIERGLLDLHGSPTVFLVVETGCTYHGELAFPDVIHAGLRVARLGGSSVRYELGLFRNEDDSAAAEGHFVHVNVGREDRRPKPISDAARGVLEALAVR
ncbi:MAG: thioesterase family protein [Pseudomonadota bacterium]